MLGTISEIQDIIYAYIIPMSLSFRKETDVDRQIVMKNLTKFDMKPAYVIGPNVRGLKF